MGLVPQVRRRIRGARKTGNIDIVYDTQPRHRDPDYGAFVDQVKLRRRIWKGRKLCRET